MRAKFSEMIDCSNLGLDDEVLEPPIKKQKQECLPRILDGTYFEVVERNMDNVHAICKLCGVKRKGTIRSTGNFLTHIKRSHPTKLTEIEEYRKLKQNESSIRRSMTTTDPLTATEVSILHVIAQIMVIRIAYSITEV